jgi:hypothetical protein
MSEPQSQPFATWAVVEVMGHRSFGGYVSEQQIAGVAFVRVDVPEVTTRDGRAMQSYTKLFGASSIYCISPVTEEVARLHESRKITGYDELRLPALLPPATVTTGDDSPRPDQLYAPVDDDGEDDERW